MKAREITVIVIILIMVIVGLIMGFVYLLSPSLLSYHFAFLGMTQDQMEPRSFELLMNMKRIIGAHFLALSLGALILVGRFAKGDVFVRWSILIMVLISQISLIYAAYVIGNQTPTRYLNVLEIVLLLVVFFMSRTHDKKETKTKKVK